MYTFKAAINQGNKEEVARLLDADPTLLEKAPLLGVTPLMQAAMAGHVKVVKLLVRKGANVRARAHAGFTCSLGCSALDYAAQGGHEEVVAYLLRKGAPANTRDKHGITPLMNACRQGHVGTVRMLVKHTKKQGLGKADYFGRTALHVATENGHEKVVAYLLRKGAKANSRDKNGGTPLMAACKGGHLAVARLLVYYLRAYYRLSGWLGQGLEMNCHDGSTALHYAAERGHVKMVAMLLEEGAQANSMDRYGRTPLMMACQGCHVGVARLLLEQGGEGLEVRDDEESTALHHAAEGGHEQIIRFLLLAGANSTPKNKYGTTPRDLAMATGDPQCTRVFDVSIQDIYIYIYILFVSIIIMYLSIYLYPWYGDCVHSALPKTPR